MRKTKIWPIFFVYIRYYRPNQGFVRTTFIFVDKSLFSVIRRSFYFFLWSFWIIFSYFGTVQYHINLSKIFLKCKKILYFTQGVKKLLSAKKSLLFIILFFVDSFWIQSMYGRKCDITKTFGSHLLSQNSLSSIFWINFEDMTKKEKLSITLFFSVIRHTRDQFKLLNIIFLKTNQLEYWKMNYSMKYLKTINEFGSEVINLRIKVKYP